MPSPAHAALLLTLPGAWFIATRPTTVDAPAMLLAWCSAWCLDPEHHTAFSAGVAHAPILSSVLLASLAGRVHERGPVFAALYAWSPWPLIGLLAVPWLAKAAAPDGDPYVGHRTLREVLAAHRPRQDMLDGRIVAEALRGVLALGAWEGLPPRAWVTFGVAWLSRLVGTDSCRFLFWAAPAMVSDLPSVPAWALALHVITFRRGF